MDVPSGYHYLETLSEGATTRIVRVETSNGERRVLKMLKDSRPKVQELARQRHEYRIVRSLKVPGVIFAEALVELDHLPVIVFEDFQGITLEQYLEKKARALSLDEFFHVGLLLVDALAGIHAANVIHLNINAQNVLISDSKGRAKFSDLQIRVIDFGISSSIEHEASVVVPGPGMAENLRTLSPEQTGRMNRLVDYRSDFYSLGVLFYQLLSKVLPFVSEDPLELMYAHIARQPRELTSLVLGLSPTLARVVGKLLEKNAEDRYQTAHGLRTDLQRCQYGWNIHSTISDFPLASEDRPSRLKIPQKLYGRAEQIEILLVAFDRVARSARELLLVAGTSGIGKTSLVRELYKPITARRGYFLSGKFDQFQRSKPYSAVVACLRELVRQVLTEGPESLERWRQVLSEAVGTNGFLVVQEIPEVEAIIGPQPVQPVAGAIEAQNRFNRVFIDFIRVFCTQEHPLTLFLDDLQWADSASLTLLHNLMVDQNTHHLMVLGAYRSNEVDPAHPLMLALEAIRKAEVTIETLELPPLGGDHVCELVAESLRSTKEQVAPLAEVLREKTDGNPFFISMYLNTLVTNRVLTFEHSAHEWSWDLPQINSLPVTQDVARTLSERIRSLEPETREILLLASCFGNQFAARDLALVSGRSISATAEILHPAVVARLVAPLDEGYKLLALGESAELSLHEVLYRFTHDRIQKEASLLKSDEEREAVHRTIGQHLLTRVNGEAGDDRIFDIVNHLNLGRRGITDQRERDTLADLNLKAGRRARASAAFAATFSYLSTGIELLGPTPWMRNYSLAHDLYVEAAEGAYLAAQYDKMEEFADTVLRRARNLLDKVPVYEIRIHAYKAKYEMSRAIKTALTVLRLLGVKLPEHPTTFDLATSSVQTMAALFGHEVESLADMPPMTNPYRLASMRIITTLSSAAFFTQPDLLPIPIFRSVIDSVRFGNAPESPPLYAAYGLVLAVMRQLENAERFADLSLHMINRYSLMQHEAKAIMLSHAFVYHWRRHLRESLEPLKRGYQVALDTGDLEYAGFCAYFNCTHGLLAGLELPTVRSEMATYRSGVEKLKHTPSWHMYCIFQQFVHNLMGASKNPKALTGDYFDENAAQPVMEQAKDFTTLFQLYTIKLIVTYHFHDFQQAVRFADLASRHLEAAGAMFLVMVFKFYASLARLAIHFKVSPAEQRRLLAQVSEYQKDLKNVAKSAPMNHQHRYHLVEAERHRVLGDRHRAEQEYALAIELSNRHAYVQDEALANELAGRFYLTYDAREQAEERLRAAWLCYQNWGAGAKATFLENRFVFLRPRPEAGGEAAKTWRMVRKAFRQMAEEVDTGRLYIQLLRHALVTVNAQSGVLLMESGGRYQIVAERSRIDDDVHLTPLQPYDVGGRLPTTIVNEVINSKLHVAIDDVSGSEPFLWRRDAYFDTHTPRSVLGFPIRRDQAIIGVLYLENNSTSAAFTTELLEVLDDLTSQFRASHEKAHLLNAVSREEKRFRELFENIADMVVLLDDEDHVILSNPAFVQTLEVPPRQVKELTFSRFVNGHDVVKLEADLFAPMREGQEARDVRFRMVTKRERELFVECNGRPISSSGGKTEFQLVIRDVTEREQLNLRIEAEHTRAHQARNATILGLATLAEYRDQDTGAHLLRMREFSRILADELSMNAEYKEVITKQYVADIHFSAILHDIGKVGIPDSVLLQPTKLSDEQWKIMRTHPTIGGDVIQRVIDKVGDQSFLQMGQQIARYHHERYDGGGYPSGKRGDDPVDPIPLAARIVALADVYDALTTERVYKKAFPHEVAKRMIVEQRGKQFDPVVVDAFLAREAEFDKVRLDYYSENERPLPEN